MTKYVTKAKVVVYSRIIPIRIKNTTIGIGKLVESNSDKKVYGIEYSHITSPVKGWIISSMLTKVVDVLLEPPIVSGELNLYRTLHPYPAIHDGYSWPARPENFPIAPNNGSFDVYSRLYTLPSKTSDGGAIRLTDQQWSSILIKNSNPFFERWAVGGTDRIMMWQVGFDVPTFHYPISFGGNLVNVLEFRGDFARIQTWPKGKDVPNNLPEYLWHRCWSVYKSLENQIRDAPCGVNHVAYPAYMLLLAHSDSAWVHRGGLIK